MAKLAYDFEDETVARRYPRHGWAKNSQGRKLLWLPICRAISGIAYPGGESRLSRNLTRGQVLEIRAFDETLSKLALTLRELSSALERGREPFIEASSAAECADREEAMSVIPLFVDLAFIYLKRIADNFARAGRFIFFRHIGSAPLKFRNLRRFVEDSQLKDLLVDPENVRKAFINHCGWFDLLAERPKTGEAKRGIRHTLEHHAASIFLQHSKIGDDPWQLDVSLRFPSQKEYVPELIHTLKRIVAEMCEFWTIICEAIRIDTEYKMWICPYGDCFLLLVGKNDDHITAIWPQL